VKKRQQDEELTNAPFRIRDITTVGYVNVFFAGRWSVSRNRFLKRPAESVVEGNQVSGIKEEECRVRGGYQSSPGLIGIDENATVHESLPA